MATKQFATEDGHQVGAYKNGRRYTVFVSDEASAIPGIGTAVLEPSERWHLISLLCPELTRLRAAAEYALDVLHQEDPSTATWHDMVDLLEQSVAAVPAHWREA